MTSRSANASDQADQRQVDQHHPADRRRCTAARRSQATVDISITSVAPLGAAEDAVRPEDQDQHQHAEGDHVAQLVRRRARRSRSAAGTGRPTPARQASRPPSMAPKMLPMPPSTAAVKALMPGRKPMNQWTWVKTMRVQDARRARQQAADGEGGDDDAVDVDAHQRGRVLVLADGAHGAPGARALDEDVEGHHEQRARRR